MENADNILETIDSDESSYNSLSGDRDGSLDMYSPFDVDADDWSQDEPRWNEFVEQINKLPADKQAVLFDADTALFLKDLTSDYKLSEDQIKNLSRVVRDTIMNTLLLEDLSVNISSKLGIGPAESSEIARTIALELFKSLEPGTKLPVVESIPERRSVKPPINDGNVVDLRNNR